MAHKNIKLKWSTMQTLLNANSILVVSGSGISKASRIPTYKEKDGLYKDPSRILYFSDLKNDPVKVWKNIFEMRKLIFDKKPNKAHYVLANWEKNKKFEHFFMATQNVDGLHQQAGNINVCELHGNIWKVARKKNISYCEDEEFSNENSLVAFDEFRDDILRKWSEENGYIVWEDKNIMDTSYEDNMRPHIQLFDEPYGNRLLWINDIMKRGVNILLIVGCSGQVNVVDKIIRETKTHNQNCLVIDINPENNLINSDVKLRCCAIDGLLLIDEVLKSK